MAVIKKEDLKTKFVNGAKPTEADFVNLIDSCYGFVKGVEMSPDKSKILVTLIEENANAIHTVEISLEHLVFPIRYDAQSKSLRIGSQTLPVKVGVNTETPTANLHVNGSLALELGKVVSEIVDVIGSQRDAAAAIPTVAAVEANFPSLMLVATNVRPQTKGSVFQFDGGLPGKFSFSITTFKHPKANFSAGSFTAPTSGLYQVEFSVFLNRWDAKSSDASIYIEKAGNPPLNLSNLWFKKGGSAFYDMVHSQAVITLQAGESISIKCWALGQEADVEIEPFGLPPTLTITRLRAI